MTEKCIRTRYSEWLKRNNLDKHYAGDRVTSYEIFKAVYTRSLDLKTVISMVPKQQLHDALFG
ncbi:hypothetical protein ACFSJY_19195 [Thalassotalea euphylliae]|uniref:hypothetical protein n=1 Tax=Thalassotalea euphylliae TaxID=1655234 RepID=UPI0036274455